MQELISRSEQKKENTWDVEKMFASDEVWEEQFKALQTEIPKTASYAGRLGEGPEVLTEALDLIYGLSRRLENLLVYAHLRSDEDTANAKYQDLQMRIRTLYLQFAAEASYVDPEMLEIGEKTLKKWLESYEPLKAYERKLELLIRQAPHTLDKEQEALLASAQEALSAPATAYALLNNADLDFGSVEHEGKTIEINHANFVLLQQSPDRELRRKVYEKYYEAFRQHENTIASLFQSNIKASMFQSRARKFPSTRAMYLFDSNVPETLYDNLIETVHDFLPAMHRYVELRKKLLGVDELHFYDVYVSLIDDYEKSYDFEEAKELVLKAVEPLGEDYVEIVRGAFRDRWMDIYPNKGKRSGAYSSGSYDSLPYMLLNYNGSLDNVFTLIHEMGHSVHSYLTKTHQPYPTGDYKIFVAEVASTCNEALLMHYLLEHTEDKTMRRVLVNEYLEKFKSTLFRQTMFAEFEKIVHAKAQNGESLTAPVLNAVYRKLNEDYFGPAMVADDTIALEWARIPHFYRDFYVYQYATGYSAAIALSRRILKEGEPAVKDYLKFLSSGSSADPIDLLKMAGVDMNEKTAVASALELFESLVSEMEELSK